MQGMIHENFPLIGTIDPQTVVNSEKFTDVIDMSKFIKVRCTFLIGNVADEGITARCVTCDSAGNNAAALKTASALAHSATLNDNSQIEIEVDGADLPGTSNADRYVKFGIVTDNTSGGPMAAAVYGWAKHGPGTSDDLSSIKEIEVDND